MCMPKTSVDEYHGKEPWKNEVRFSRIPFVAYPVSESGLEKCRANFLFRFGIPCLYVRHDFMPFIPCKYIHGIILSLFFALGYRKIPIFKNGSICEIQELIDTEAKKRVIM